MNITKNEVDALNLLVNIEIAPENYQSKVDSVLLNYRKTALYLDGIPVSLPFCGN